MEKVDRPLGPVVVDIAGTSLTDEEVKILQNPIGRYGHLVYAQLREPRAAP